MNSIQVHPLDVAGIYDPLMWRLTHQSEAAHMGGPPAILSLQTMPAPWRLITADAEASVAQYYGIPVASYRQAIYPSNNGSFEAWAPYAPFWHDPDKAARGEMYGTHPSKCEWVADGRISQSQWMA